MLTVNLHGSYTLIMKNKTDNVTQYFYPKCLTNTNIRNKRFNLIFMLVLLRNVFFVRFFLISVNFLSSINGYEL